MATPATYVDSDSFTTPDNQVAELPVGRKLTLYQGVDGNAVVKVVSSAYQAGPANTLVHVSPASVTSNLATIQAGATSAESGGIHDHTSDSQQGDIPAAHMSQSEIDFLESLPIPSAEADEHKFIWVKDPYTDGMEFVTLAGTTNQVTLTVGSQTLTFSLPQSIHTAATPTFAGMTLSGLTGIMEAKGASAIGIVTGTSLQIFRRNEANTAYEFVTLTLDDISDAAFTSVAEGDVIYRNGSSQWVNLALGTTGYFMKAGASAPAWGAIAFKELSDVTDAVSDSAAAGDVIYHNGTAYTRLAVGTNGEVLAAVNGIPSWEIPEDTYDIEELQSIDLLFY